MNRGASVGMNSRQVRTTNAYLYICIVSVYLAPYSIITEIIAKGKRERR